MSWLRILEKIIFWLLYVLPYFLFMILWLVSTDNTTDYYHFSLQVNGLSSELNSETNQGSNIFSNFYDTLMLFLYGIGLFGIYTWLYNKEYFSKKFWLFNIIVLGIDTIGRTLYNLENFLISIIFLIYLIYYFLTLFLLIRSYHE